MLKQTLITFLCLATVLAETAYFSFLVLTDIQANVFQLTNDTLIKHARDLLRGVTFDQQRVSGKIIKGQASYNPNYSFFLDPKTIEFFDNGDASCDQTLQYTEAHLADVCGSYLPNCFYCPNTSILTGEIKVNTSTITILPLTN